MMIAKKEKNSAQKLMMLNDKPCLLRVPLDDDVCIYDSCMDVQWYYQNDQPPYANQLQLKLQSIQQKISNVFDYYY